MKLVKIILGLVILLSAVFFSTGLIVKEVYYTSDVMINKPIDQVFSKFENNDSMQEWVLQIKSFEVEIETPQKVGSIYNLVVDNKGTETKIREKILAFIPKEKVTYRFSSESITRLEDYEFTSQGDKTKVTQKTRIVSGSYLLACTFPWFKSKFMEGTQANLKNLKLILENSI